MSFYKTILQEAIEIFHSYGIQSLTEQALIRKLNVAPATFNEMFDSKEDLLQQAVQHHLEQEQVQHKLIATASLNAVEELVGMLNHGVAQLKSINPVYFQELIRHYPGIWELYIQNSQQHTIPRIEEVLKKGMLDEQFISNLNISLVTRQILGQVNIIFDQALFPADEFPLDEVYKTVYLHLIRGLCTTQGLKVVERMFPATAAKKPAAAPAAEAKEAPVQGLEGTE